MLGIGLGLKAKIFGLGLAAPASRPCPATQCLGLELGL